MLTEEVRKFRQISLKFGLSIENKGIFQMKDNIGYIFTYFLRLRLEKEKVSPLFDQAN
ncbi:MAG: hypothetical protein ACREPR_24350 [Brasilonema sp.]